MKIRYVGPQRWVNGWTVNELCVEGKVHIMVESRSFFGEHSVDWGEPFACKCGTTYERDFPPEVEKKIRVFIDANQNKSG